MRDDVSGLMMGGFEGAWLAYSMHCSIMGELKMEVDQTRIHCEPGGGLTDLIISFSLG